MFLKKKYNLNQLCFFRKRLKGRSTLALARGRSTPTLVGGRSTDALASGRSTDALASGRSTGALASGRSTDALASGRSTDALASGRSTDALASGRSTGALASGRSTDALTSGRSTGALASGRSTDALASGRSTDTIVSRRSTPTLVGGVKTPSLLITASLSKTPLFHNGDYSKTKFISKATSVGSAGQNTGKPVLERSTDALTSGKKLYTAYSKLSEIKLISIELASSNTIRKWAEKTLPNGKILGQVTTANTLHHKSFKPLKGGLFCERIFGPLKDFECACGKIQRPGESEYLKILENQQIDRKFCPNCDVEYTWSIIRRYQMGYIELASPVSHIWYLKANPSYLSILLDMKRKHLENIIYCSEISTLENSWKSNQNFGLSTSPSSLFLSWQKLIQHNKFPPQPLFEGRALAQENFSTQNQSFVPKEQSKDSLVEQNREDEVLTRQHFQNEVLEKDEVQHLTVLDVSTLYASREGGRSTDTTLSVRSTPAPYSKTKFSKKSEAFGKGDKRSFLLSKKIFPVAKRIKGWRPALETESNLKNQIWTEYSLAFQKRSFWKERKTSYQSEAWAGSFLFPKRSFGKKPLPKLRFGISSKAKLFRNPVGVSSPLLSETSFFPKLLPKLRFGIGKKPEGGEGRNQFFAQQNIFSKLDIKTQEELFEMIYKKTWFSFYKIAYKVSQQKSHELLLKFINISEKKEYISLKSVMRCNTGRSILVLTPSSGPKVKLWSTVAKVRVRRTLEQSGVLRTDVTTSDFSIFKKVFMRFLESQPPNMKEVPLTSLLPFFNNLEHFSCLEQDYIPTYLNWLIENKDEVLPFKREGVNTLYASREDEVQYLTVLDGVLLLPEALLREQQKGVSPRYTSREDEVQGMRSKRQDEVQIRQSFGNEVSESTRLDGVLTRQRQALDEVLPRQWEGALSPRRGEETKFPKAKKTKFFAFDVKSKFRKAIAFSHKQKQVHKFVHLFKYFLKKRLLFSIRNQSKFMAFFIKDLSLSETSFPKDQSKALEKGVESAYAKNIQKKDLMTEICSYEFLKSNLFFVKILANQLTKLILTYNFKENLINFSLKLKANNLSILDKINLDSNFKRIKNLRINDSDFTFFEILKLIKKQERLSLSLECTSFYFKKIRNFGLSYSHLQLGGRSTLALFPIPKLRFGRSFGKRGRSTPTLVGGKNVLELSVKIPATEAAVPINHPFPKLCFGNDRGVPRPVAYFRKLRFRKTAVSVFRPRGFLSSTAPLAYATKALLSRTFGNFVSERPKLRCSKTKFWKGKKWKTEFSNKLRYQSKLSKIVNPLDNYYFNLDLFSIKTLTISFFVPRSSNISASISLISENPKQLDPYVRAPFVYSLSNSKNVPAYKLVNNVEKDQNNTFYFKNIIFSRSYLFNKNRCLSKNIVFVSRKNLFLKWQNKWTSFFTQTLGRSTPAPFPFPLRGSFISETPFPNNEVSESTRGEKTKFSKKSEAFGKIRHLNNTIYSLSHRCHWKNEKSWQDFAYYNLAPRDFDDLTIPCYKNRTMNSVDSLTENSITGAAVIQRLLLELNTTELKKMDKQNRILLYELTKKIQKFKNFVRRGIADKFDKKQLKGFCEQRDQLIRRTKLVRKLCRKNSNPESMILSVLPVLPPDLRPILKIQEQIAASDLNRLYQRVIYRNDRFKKFQKDAALSNSFEIKYSQRLLQEAVDNLIQNGKSGVTPERDSRGRLLKSLSEVLKGKQGRFRQYLLGKRVDYSGRSVIVVGPQLKLHECGLPREMALELFLPFLIQRILHYKHAKTVIGAKTLLKKNRDLTSKLLREIMQTNPVLLNRAPTLHRLGFQAFQPKLIEGRAILLHPLVCPAFNADFDGDQMAVHIPLTVEARTEAWKLMFSRNNIISPATGDPVMLPSQDMVLGCYYLTTEIQKRKRGETTPLPGGVGTLIAPNMTSPASDTSLPSGRSAHVPAGGPDAGASVLRPAIAGTVLRPEISKEFHSFYGSKTYQCFSNLDQVIKAYQLQKISLHEPIWIKWHSFFENANENNSPHEIRVEITGSWQEIRIKYQRRFDSNGCQISQMIRTTPGRILFHMVLERSKKDNKRLSK